MGDRYDSYDAALERDLSDEVERELDRDADASAADELLRCGSCGHETTPEAMVAHISTCDGWVTYEGHALAELAVEAGFDVEYERRSWFERVILRRKDRYVIPA
jgi:hypothetical protein